MTGTRTLCPSNTHENIYQYLLDRAAGYEGVRVGRTVQASKGVTGSALSLWDYPR